MIRKIKPDAADDLIQTRADPHRTDASSKIKKYIGPKERDLILEIFEHDFKIFGYSMDPHFGAV